MDATFKREKPPNPRSKANIFEIITYSWILKLIKKGLKCDLDLIDLYTILDGDSSASLGSKLQKLWNDELINAKKRNQKPSFLKTLFQMFGVKFMIYGTVLTIVDITLSISNAILVGKIVFQFGPTTSVDKNPTGVYLVFCLIISLILRSIIYNHFDMMMTHLAMQMRVATCDLIYNKALRLKTNSLDQTLTGHIINLMSNDVNRFDESLIYLPFLWTGPLVTIVATYFMWQEVGVSSVLGVSTLIICVPLQVWLGFKTSEIRSKIANKTDERVNLMKEIISGLQVIKMYTWEPFFGSLIKNVRKNEVKKIIKSTYVKSILASFVLFSSRIALFVNLFSYVQLGNLITASKVFEVTSYYSILNMYMAIAFAPGVGLAAELFVSIQRFEAFLLREEKNSQSPHFIRSTSINGVSNKEKNDNNTVQKNVNNQNDNTFLSNFDIVISNATAKWIASQADYSLEKINLTVERGQLVAIVGPVGAGKVY